MTTSTLPSERQIIVELFAFDRNKRTSDFLHPEIQAMGCDLVERRQDGKDQRLNAAMVRTSFLLCSMDYRLRMVHEESVRFLAEAPRPSQVGARPGDHAAAVHQCAGRDTWPIVTNLLGCVTDCRTLLDHSLVLVAAALGLRPFDDMSFRWVNERKGNRQLRQRLGDAGAVAVVEVIEHAWKEWAAELRNYRDLTIHYNPMPIAPLEIVRHESEDRFVGVRVHIAGDPTKRSGSNGGSFADAIIVRRFRDQALRLVQELLAVLLLVKPAA